MAGGTKPGRKKATRGRGGAGEKPLETRRRGEPKAAAPRIERALEALTRFLDARPEPSAIIGGIAVIAWGFGRSTLDLDVSLEADPAQASTWLRRFAKAGFVARIAGAAAFARESFVLLLRHEATGLDVDVALAQIGFEHEALRRTERRAFGAVDIRVVSATDLVVLKMLAGRPRDVQDVEELLARGAPVNATRVVRALSDFDALLGLDRARAFRALRRRARG